ncbi:MAG TPA: hypothetical protein VIG51_07910 [Candidatus Baltobacteraceae bacterium]
MIRFARFALAAALVVALCFGARAFAAFPPTAHLSYNRVFDRTNASFLRAAVAMLPSTNLISDSAFGIDVELPIFMRTSATKALYDGSGAVRLAENLQRLNVSAVDETPWVTGLTFRMHGAKIQMQYQTVDAASTAPSRAAARVAMPPVVPNEFASLNVAGYAPSFSYSSQAPFSTATPGNFYAPFSTAPQAIAQRLTLPVRIGPVRLSNTLEESALPNRSASSFDAMSQCGTADPNGACAALHQQDNRLAAGTSFNVRAGARRVNLNVTGSVERQSLPDDTSFPYLPLDPQAPQASTQAAPLGGGSAISYPNLVDVTKHGLNANLAVPVANHLTVNLGYDTQHFQGGYNAATSTGNASTLIPGIDARKDTYLGNITYQLPHTNSAITFSARQYRYQDNFVPNLNLTQTRADVNFTVKF